MTATATISACKIKKALDRLPSRIGYTNVARAYKLKPPCEVECKAKNVMLEKGWMGRR